MILDNLRELQEARDHNWILSTEKVAILLNLQTKNIHNKCSRHDFKFVRDIESGYIVYVYVIKNKQALKQWESV